MPWDSNWPTILNSVILFWWLDAALNYFNISASEDLRVGLPKVRANFSLKMKKKSFHRHSDIKSAKTGRFSRSILYSPLHCFYLAHLYKNILQHYFWKMEPSGIKIDRGIKETFFALHLNAIYFVQFKKVVEVLIEAWW